MNRVRARTMTAEACSGLLVDEAAKGTRFVLTRDSIAVAALLPIADLIVLERLENGLGIDELRRLGIEVET